MPVKISPKAARVNAGYTIVQAAPLLGVGKDTLIKWEKQPERIPTTYQLKFSELYQIPVDNIFFGF